MNKSDILAVLFLIFLFGWLIATVGIAVYGTKKRWGPKQARQAAILLLIPFCLALVLALPLPFYISLTIITLAAIAIGVPLFLFSDWIIKQHERNKGKEYWKDE